MSCEVGSLDQFPHFKSQWRSFGSCYKHLYSSDQCEIRSLRRISVKELDLYSTREAYSFPFCPRVYKYSIEKNELIDNQIAFDIKLLLEHVPKRLNNVTPNEQITSKTIDILRALEYLRMRFGPFHIKKGMIGWTALGIAKVWINEDFAANNVEVEASSEEEMLQDLYTLFSENQKFNQLKEERFISLSSMIQYMEENWKLKNQPSSKKKALQQIENFDNSEISFDRHNGKEELPEVHSTKSRKNITFSYSNKNIAEKSMRRGHNASKRSSIVLIEDDFRFDVARASETNKGLTFGNHHPSSLKVINQKIQNQKKTSIFRPLGLQCHAQNGEGVTIKKLSDYFSMSSQMNLQNQVPKISEIYRHSVQEKPEYLHYSTSSNPYSKIGSKSTKNADILKLGECEQFLFNDAGENTSSQGKEERSGTINELDQELTEFTICEKKRPGVAAEQQVKDELDALFNSDHEFDYGELENQLDHVLL